MKNLARIWRVMLSSPRYTSTGLKFISVPGVSINFCQGKWPRKVWNIVQSRKSDQNSVTASHYHSHEDKSRFFLRVTRTVNRSFSLSLF